MDTVYQSLVDDNASIAYSTGAIVAEPMLASNWTVSANGLTYTFNLRNVTFSNGYPFNAYQVWGEMYADYYFSGNSSNWMTAYNVFNMSSVNFGPATLALLNQSGVVNPSAQGIALMSNSSWPIYAPNPSQIVFQLAAPFQWLPQTQIAFTGLLYDTQFVLNHGGFGNLTQVNPYFNLSPIPGTGPYMVSGVQENAYVQFTQSPTYWGKDLTPAQIQANPYLDPGHVKNVIIYAKTDDVARYADLASGQVQISSIETQDWPLIQQNPTKYAYAVLPNNSMAFVGSYHEHVEVPHEHYRGKTGDRARDKLLCNIKPSLFQRARAVHGTRISVTSALLRSRQPASISIQRHAGSTDPAKCEHQHCKLAKYRVQGRSRLQLLRVSSRNHPRRLEPDRTVHQHRGNALQRVLPTIRRSRCVRRRGPGSSTGDADGLVWFRDLGAG